MQKDRICLIVMPCQDLSLIRLLYLFFNLAINDFNIFKIKSLVGL